MEKEWGKFLVECGGLYLSSTGKEGLSHVKKREGALRGEVTTCTKDPEVGHCKELHNDQDGYVGTGSWEVL